MFRPEVETRSPSAQLARDCETWKAQIAYLFARSAFYWEKLRAAGIAGPEEAGSLDELGRLPFTEKDEDPAQPVRASAVRQPSRNGSGQLARIYSTSGTTGDPVYMPVTANDLAIWIEIFFALLFRSRAARRDA